MCQGGIWAKDFFLQRVSEHEVIKHGFLSWQKRSQTWLSSMVFCSFSVSWNGASKAQICFWFLFLLLLFFNSISSRCGLKCSQMCHWDENWVGVDPSDAPSNRRRAWSWVCPSVMGLMVTDFTLLLLSCLHPSSSSLPPKIYQAWRGSRRGEALCATARDSVASDRP